MKRNSVRKYNVLDLFAGIGGLSLGFKKFFDQGRKYNPFSVVAALEKDKHAADTLVAALIREGLTEKEAEKKVICGDITEAKIKEKLYSICTQRVDVIIGGPPCQSFSMIGPRSGDKQQQEKYLDDDRDNLFEHYIEIVQHYRPLYFVFENVKGILSKKDKQGNKYIDIITQRFESIGYCLEVKGEDGKKHMLLNAVDYGVPQKRERVIIIGNRIGTKNKVPEPTHGMKSDSGLPYVTLRDAIGDLPGIVAKLTTTPKEKRTTKKKAVISEERKRYIEIKNKDRFDGHDLQPYHWRNFYLHYNSGSRSRKLFMDFVRPANYESMLIGHKARRQQESDIELFEEMEEGMTAKDIVMSDDVNNQRLASLIKYNMDSFEDKYKKLTWDEPCHTIIAHLQKDGNRYIHPDPHQGRTLTVREAARIQSFPDDYEIKSVGNVRFKYIGNAVPPLLSLAIAKTIFRELKKIRIRRRSRLL